MTFSSHIFLLNRLSNRILQFIFTLETDSVEMFGVNGKNVREWQRQICKWFPSWFIWNIYLPAISRGSTESLSIKSSKNCEILLTVLILRIKSMGICKETDKMIHRNVAWMQKQAPVNHYSGHSYLHRVVADRQGHIEGGIVTRAALHVDTGLGECHMITCARCRQKCDQCAN